VDGFAIIGGNGAMYQFFATLTACHTANAHATFFAGIRRHG